MFTPGPILAVGLTWASELTPGSARWTRGGRNWTTSSAKVLQADNPGEAKAIGRSVRNFQREKWQKHCVERVVQGNVAKFAQNKEILTYLLATNNKVLVEASPYDTIWGIGLASDAEDIENPLTWKGKNLLGFALMEARAGLTEKCPQTWRLHPSKVERHPVLSWENLK